MTGSDYDDRMDQELLKAAVQDHLKHDFEDIPETDSENEDETD